MSRKLFAACAVGSALCFFTPWFTLDGEVPGFYSGVNVFLFAAAQFIYILRFLSDKQQTGSSVVIMELCLLSIPLVQFCGLKNWITDYTDQLGDMLQLALQAAQPGFWLALGFAVLAFVTFQFQLFPGRKIVNR